MYLLLLVVALIVHGSLNPWHFDFARTATNPFLVVLQSWPDRWDFNAAQDAVLNVMLYVPLGVAAFRVAARKTAAGGVVTALCLGFSLSGGLELLQVYVPSRIGSICDVSFNMAGTLGGILLAYRFSSAIEAAIDSTRSYLYARLGSPPGLLLACWATYQLYPIVPHFRPGSLPAAVIFLLNPRGLDPNSPYPAEILLATAEWFAVALAMKSLLDRMRPYWLIFALCFRLLVRPFMWTAPFGLEDFLGVVFAMLLWIGLPEKMRWRAGLTMLGGAMLIRQLAPLHFSHLSHDFSPIGDIIRRAFDCGAVVWILWSDGIAPDRAGALFAVFLALMAGLHRHLTASGTSIADPVLMTLAALAFWLNKSGWFRSVTTAGTH